MQILIQENTDSKILIHLESNTILQGTYISAEYNISEDYKLNQLERIANMVDVIDNPKSEQSEYITNTKIISTYKDVIEHFKPSNDKYFVTGITDSKVGLIDKYFRKEIFFNSDEQLKPFIKNNTKKIVGDENNKPIEIEEDYSTNTIIRTNVKLEIPGLNSSAMILSENQSTITEYVLYLDTENPIKYIDLGNGFATFTYMRSHISENEVGNIVLYEGFLEEPKIISEVFIDRGLNTAFEKIKKLKNIRNINELIKNGLGYYKINTNGYNFKRN
jgi:hypothetical protein